MAEKSEKALEGELIENRVVVSGAAGVQLYDESGFGKPFPDEKPDRLELELVEAAYLLEKGRLKVRLDVAYQPPREYIETAETLTALERKETSEMEVLSQEVVR